MKRVDLFYDALFVENCRKKKTNEFYKMIRVQNVVRNDTVGVSHISSYSNLDNKSICFMQNVSHIYSYSNFDNLKMLNKMKSKALFQMKKE